MEPIKKEDDFYLFENYEDAFKYYERLSHLVCDNKKQKDEYIVYSLRHISKMVRPCYLGRGQTEIEKHAVCKELKECLLWVV